MNKLFFIILCLFVIVASGCIPDAQIASHNLSREADQFGINRRIIFYNAWQDVILLEILGFCSIEADSSDSQLEVTCKTGQDKYKKHFLGIGGNISYFVEQIDSEGVSLSNYKVIIRPSALIPDIDIE